MVKKIPFKTRSLSAGAAPRSHLETQVLLAQAVRIRETAGPDNKTFKVQRLIKALQDSAGGMSIQQIAGYLDVNERTVKRYLSEIRRWKYDIIQDENGANRKSLYFIRKNGFSGEHFLPSLKKIRAELHAGGNPKHSSAISQIIRYFEEKGEPPQETGSAIGEAYHIDHGPFSEAEPPAGILKILESAIVGHTMVKIAYSGYTRDNQDFVFFPYQLSLRVGTLYLVGRQEKNQGPFKSLSVKRIKRCIATRETFSPAAFDIREYYKYCFGQWPRQLNEPPQTIQLKLLSPWLEKYLSESHFNPPGKIQRKGKETFFELQVVLKPDFVNWVISMIPDGIPVSPAELCAKVGERLKLGMDLLDGGN